MDIRDFADIVYSYAVDGSEQRTLHRDSFIEYIHDLKPDPMKMENAEFKTQAKSMIDDLDSFRSGFGQETPR